MYSASKRFEVEVPVGDEPGIAIERRYDTFSLASSIWRSRDQRYPSSFVGFKSVSIRELNRFLSEVVYKNGVVAPRRNTIDKDLRLSKIVVVIFVMCGDSVLLIPRRHKRILPDVFTLSIMESLTLYDICSTFHTDISIRQILGESPYAISCVDPCRDILHNLDLIEIAKRSIEEECPYIGDDVSFTGFVGGGKDLGIVLGKRVGMSELRRIARITESIIFDKKRTTYNDISEYYGGRIDGWSEAILKYITS